MRTLPTDLQIFNAIYDEYYQTFIKFSEKMPSRQTKNYVPIDIAAIADRLKIDGDIIFGRLYYLHRRKYSYEESVDGREINVPFFDVEILNDRHAIHFPLMAAILADLMEEERRNKAAIRLALAAIAVSIASATFSFMGLFSASA